MREKEGRVGGSSGSKNWLKHAQHSEVYTGKRKFSSLIPIQITRSYEI
jgi:hypothetical protein